MRYRKKKLVDSDSPTYNCYINYLLNTFLTHIEYEQIKRNAWITDIKVESLLKIRTPLFFGVDG